MQLACGRFREPCSIIAVAFASFAKPSRSLSRFTAGSSCSLFRAHGIVTVAIASPWRASRSLRRFAEAIAVAFRDLAEFLRSLLRFAAVSSWPLLRAHGIIAIASAICRITCGRFLRLTGFIAIAFLRGRGHIAITLARSWEIGEHGSQASWWQRRKVSCLEGRLRGVLEENPWG